MSKKRGNARQKVLCPEDMAGWDKRLNVVRKEIAQKCVRKLSKKDIEELERTGQITHISKVRVAGRKTAPGSNSMRVLGDLPGGF